MSADGEWLALDQVGEDGYFDIYVMRPDTSNKRCLTCDKSSDIVPQKHNGTAEWHPSGDYLVFTAEKQKHPGGSLWAEPGKGVYNDIWFMKADGSEFWPLTDGPADNDHGSIHPHFSSDGKRLA